MINVNILNEEYYYLNMLITLIYNNYYIRTDVRLFVLKKVDVLMLVSQSVSFLVPEYVFQDPMYKVNLLYKRRCYN